MAEASFSLTALLNRLAAAHAEFAAAMFLEVAVLFAVLACLDVLLLRRLRAAVRYGVWSLVLVKLLLPVDLPGPLSLTGWWDAKSAQPSLVGNQAVPPAPLFAPHAGAGHMSEDGRPVAFDRAKLSDARLEHSPQAAAAPAATVVESFSWQAVLFLGWLTAVAVLLTLFMGRMLHVARLVRSAEVAPVALQALLSECQQRLGLQGQRIGLRLADQLPSPAICGFWRATILFPRSLVERLDDQQRRLVLIHELAHWKRFDLQVNCLQTLLQIAYFYNPLVWVANVMLRRLREQAVDEVVLVTMRASAERYSSTLLDIVSQSRPAPAIALRLVGVVESRKALAGRIRRIVARPTPNRARLGYGGLALVLLIGLMLLPLGGRQTAASDAPAAKKSAQPAAKQSVEAPPQNPVAAAQLAAKELPRGELAGRVVDEQGQPLEGVTIDVWHWHPGNETKTDAEGRFRLKDLGLDRKVEVLVSKPDYTPQHFPQQPTGGKEWVIALSNKTYMEGTIRDSDGQPVAGADVRASFGPVEGDGFVMSEVMTEGKSGDDGAYRLYVAPGTYDVQVSAGSRGVFRASSVGVPSGAARQLPVQLRQGVRFEARVVDSLTKEPVEGFVLWRWLPPKMVGRSDAEGKIVFEGLVPGKQEFDCGGGEAIVQASGVRYFRHGPFGRWWSPEAIHKHQRFHIDDEATGWQRNFDGLEFDLQVGMPHVTILVEQGVSVSGRVTDPDGKPVAGATVDPARTGSANSITGDTRYSATTDKQGRYRVVLPASNKARYNLVAHDGKYQEWRKWANGVAAPMQTTPGQVIEGLDLQLSRPAVIKGRVTLKGRPLAGREVRAQAADKLENRYYDPTGRTKPDGTYELSFVRPGKHFVQVAPFWLSAEDASAGTKIVEVAAGEPLEGIDLQALPDQNAAGMVVPSKPVMARVLDANQKPVAGVEAALGFLGGVRGQLAAIGGQHQPDLAAPKTDKQGRLPLAVESMSQLRMRESLVYAVDATGRRAGVALLNLMEIAANDAGGDMPLVFDVPLGPATTVKIELAATAFESIPNKPGLIHLSIAKDGMGLQQGALEDAGIWQVLLPPGSYRVSAASPHSGVASAEFELKSGQPSHELKLELEPSRLAKLMGQPAPPFQQARSTTDAAPIRLEDLKGKVVVIDFWGAWCGPCVAAMPNLMELYDEFHEQGVEFIALHDDSVESVDALKESVQTLARDHWQGREIPFTLLLDGGGERPIPGSEAKARGATTAAYGVTTFPTTLVIDRQGRVADAIEVRNGDAARQRLKELLQ